MESKIINYAGLGHAERHVALEWDSDTFIVHELYYRFKLVGTRRIIRLGGTLNVILDSVPPTFIGYPPDLIGDANLVKATGSFLIN
jgi:hypothetical protein